LNFRTSRLLEIKFWAFPRFGILGALALAMLARAGATS
jgi:hypothetical protein